MVKTILTTAVISAATVIILMRVKATREFLTAP